MGASGNIMFSPRASYFSSNCVTILNQINHGKLSNLYTVYTRQICALAGLNRNFLIFLITICKFHLQFYPPGLKLFSLRWGYVEGDLLYFLLYFIYFQESIATLMCLME